MLAILTTHPIQYQAPIWRALAARGRIPLKVFYLSDQGLAARHDPGFGRAVAWDIDLLSGYDHEFIDAARGNRQDSFWWLRLKSDFVSKLQRHGARVLWAQGWQVAAYWQALWRAHAAGLETWLRAETNLTSTSKGWSRFVKDAALAALFARVDKFLCIGEANRKFYESRNVSAERLTFAPYCVDNARFRAEALRLRSQRSALRAAWGIPENAYCILFVGKLIEKKRPLDLVEAARLVQSKMAGRPVHLLFVGAGAMLDEVRSRCNVVFDHAGAVTPSRRDVPAVTASFAGFLNQGEIARAYLAADCLALPSEGTETWGLVVNEAMACGLPVVVSDACGCSGDLVTPTWPDLCFPLGDVSQFADSIVSMMSAPPSLTEIHTIIDHYDVMRVVETVEDLYLGAKPA